MKLKNLECKHDSDGASVQHTLLQDISGLVDAFPPIIVLPTHKWVNQKKKNNIYGFSVIYIVTFYRLT